MTIIAPQPSSFMEELEILQNRFASMEPEVVETLEDKELGVKGFVVVWNTEIALDGPLGACGKGGTRITPDVTLADVKMLAYKMALKNAAAGLPLGGSKAGLIGNPDEEGFEKKYRRFVSLCKPLLRENGGKFGGFGFDIGARPVHPIWACDELQSTKSFTGKPLHMGGTDYDVEGLAGLGVATAAKALLDFHDISPKLTTYAVQGLGAMGSAVIRYFSEFKTQLIAVSDLRLGGTWEFESFASQKIIKAIAEHRIDDLKILLPEEATQISDDSNEVLYTKCDIIFPCAIQGVIHSDNVDKIQAKYIVEGANGPCDNNVYPILHQKKITVIPDFIANSGGIIAAFVEMSSTISPEENIKNRTLVLQSKELILEKISQNVRVVLDLVYHHKVMPTQAALYMALSRIFGTRDF